MAAKVALSSSSVKAIFGKGRVHANSKRKCLFLKY